MIFLPYTADIPSLVPMIFLTGAEYPQRYSGYTSQVHIIFLKGTAYPKGYCGQFIQNWRSVAEKRIRFK